METGLSAMLLQFFGMPSHKPSNRAPHLRGSSHPSKHTSLRLLTTTSQASTWTLSPGNLRVRLIPELNKKLCDRLRVRLVPGLNNNLSGQNIYMYLSWEQVLYQWKLDNMFVVQRPLWTDLKLFWQSIFYTTYILFIYLFTYLMFKFLCFIYIFILLLWFILFFTLFIV